MKNKMILGMIALALMGCNSSDQAAPTVSPGTVAPNNPVGGHKTPLMKLVDHDITSQSVSAKATKFDVASRQDISGAFELHLDATVDGGSGVNSVMFITVQFANWGDFGPDNVANYYRWTLQTDEVGRNNLYVTQGLQTGPSSSQETVIASIAGPGQSLTLQVQRDDQNTYFNYSTDSGATWVTAFSIALSDFDGGEAVLQADTWNAPGVQTCSFNDQALPCFEGDPSYVEPVADPVIDTGGTSDQTVN
jgi:hypothetical protein